MSDTDLILTRSLTASPPQIWRAWTEPALLRQWFAPRPVETVDAVVDLRPGGRFYTLMRLPDGTDLPNEGCILLIEPNRRLIMTDCLHAGFRPAAKPLFTVEITLARQGTGTAYQAHAWHARPEDAAHHADMGFHEGWGTATSQLEALAKTL